MNSNFMSVLEFSSIPPEDLSDFASLPWYQALLDDPTFTPIRNRSRNDSNDRRTFFPNTLWTDKTIRASKCFYKGRITPERWSGAPRPLEAQRGLGECRMVFSLGEGVSGGMKNVAHGGLMATLLDETLGTPVFTQWMTGCVMAELTVKYERPLPVPGVVLCRSWIEKTKGRKVWIQGVLEDGRGLVFATGRSLFIRFREKL